MFRENRTEYFKEYRAKNREKVNTMNREWMKRYRTMKKPLTTSIQYEVKHELPANYEELQEKYDGKLNFDQGSVITYDGVIYSKHPFPDHVLAHELVHIQQQEVHGDIDDYVDRYMNDIPFRLQAELEGFQEEYRYIVKTTSKHHHYLALMQLAKTLSENYGFEGMTIATAVDLIAQGKNKPSLIA